jgi:hypothetical protein
MFDFILKLIDFNPDGFLLIPVALQFIVVSLHVFLLKGHALFVKVSGFLKFDGYFS